MELLHQSSSPSTISAVADFFNYLNAPAIIAYYATAQLYAAINLQKPNKQPVNRRKRLAVGALTLLLLTTYFAEAIFYIARAFSETSWIAPQSSIIHVLSAILIWVMLNLTFWSTSNHIWHPYVGAWLVGAVIEVVLCALTAKSITFANRYQRSPLILNAIRVFIYVVLLLTCLSIALEARSEDATDEEQQPLLSPAAAAPEEDANGNPDGLPNANGTANKSYDTIESDDDPPDRDADIKKEQQRRLEEEGGWIGYLKGFYIFLPYLWPDDWKGKGCLGVMLLNIIQGRVFNILVPRQIGIVTNKLIEGGPVPWREALVWFLMDWVNGWGGFRILATFASQHIENIGYRKILGKSFGHVMDLSMDFHSNKDSGEVLKSVEQASSLNTLVELVIDIGPVLVDFVVALWFVSHILNIYASYTIVVLTVSYIWIAIALTGWQAPARRTMSEKDRAQNKTVYESVSNWQTVAYFNRGEYEGIRFKDAIHESLSSYWTYLFRVYAGVTLQSFIMNLGWSICILMALREISDGQKPVGNLVTFIMYWGTIVSPLYTISYSYRQVISTLVDAERILQLLRTKPTVVNKPNATELINPKGRVEFDHVNFSYDPRKSVLKDFNFVAEPGTTIAFVGETGGGKSTTLKLLFRFYDVTSGAILIDGHNVQDLTISSLREALGVVPQDPALFNTTIRENIRYARLDATDEDIIEACKAAAVHDKIMSFPDGYASKVGERGVKLSGGELQRVAIARVLIKNPSIVMLDEATSAVDSSTEQLIQEAFRRLSTGRTTFVVAHRLSTIMEADAILVVDKGEIVERGTHDELLMRGGKYFELWTKQTVRPSKANSNIGSDADAKDDVGGATIVNDLAPEAYDQEMAKVGRLDGTVKGAGVGGSQPSEGGGGGGESSQAGAGKQPVILVTPPAKKGDEATEEEEEGGDEDVKGKK
jgi:ABC-type transport system involved in Fe-S cluster assembly fused permease/ATPase subunit